MKENDEQKKTSEANLLIEKRLRFEHQRGQELAEKDHERTKRKLRELELEKLFKDQTIVIMEEQLKKRKAVGAENAKSKKKFKFTIEVEVDGEKLEGSSVSVD